MLFWLRMHYVIIVWYNLAFKYKIYFGNSSTYCIFYIYTHIVIIWSVEDLIKADRRKKKNLIHFNVSNETVHSIKKVWYYLPTPPLGQDMTQGQFLSEV